MCSNARRIAASLPPGVECAKSTDGALMLRTRFEFPDGDLFPIHVTEIAPGRVRLSDQGHTVMHISYDHDVDALFRTEGLAVLDGILADTQVTREGAVFSVDTSVAEVGAAGVRFGRALSRIYEPAASGTLATQL